MSLEEIEKFYNKQKYISISSQTYFGFETQIYGNSLLVGRYWCKNTSNTIKIPRSVQKKKLTQVFVPETPVNCERCYSCSSSVRLKFNSR